MLTQLTLVFSMCSSKYCSSFAPLFFLFFGLSLFFWEISTFLFYFFDIFSLLRSTKEVTTENMSSNKCKTWPMKFLENLLKIDKNLVTTKRWSCDHFLTNLKFSNPKTMGNGRIRNFFLIGFDIWNVEIGVRMRKLDQNWLRIRGQNGNNNFKQYFQVVNDLNWKSCQLQSFITFRDLQLSFWLFLHPMSFTKFEF